MAVKALSATRTICELRDWSVSNLEIQKILYVAQMIHIGENDGEPLIFENFEAWDYGPVVPQVYRHSKGFGSRPVKNVFHWIKPVEEETPEYQSITEAVNLTKGLSASRLVAVTHWKEGAWYKCYGEGTRGVQIPNTLIAEEFGARIGR